MNNNNNWLSQYRGALWGLLAGGAIGFAIALNALVAEPSFVVPGIVALWVTGGLFGHAMHGLMSR